MEPGFSPPIPEVNSGIRPEKEGGVSNYSTGIAGAQERVLGELECRSHFNPEAKPDLRRVTTEYSHWTSPDAKGNKEPARDGIFCLWIYRGPHHHPECKKK